MAILVETIHIKRNTAPVASIQPHLRPQFCRFNVALMLSLVDHGLNGKKIGVSKTVITPTRMDSGTPILTKSPKLYSPGP